MLRESVGCQRVEDAQPRKTPKAVVVRSENEPVLDCERSDLDVRHIVAAEPGRPG
jgi:hypothetical protein